MATERKTTVLSDTLVEGAKELMDAEGALLFLIDAEQGEILQAAFAGVSFEGGIPQGPLSKIGLFGLACQEKRPVLIENPGEHPLKGTTPSSKLRFAKFFRSRSSARLEF
ncbi:MAG: GAF domain-containing protein [Candidatus Manganitrophus sp.]|nr:GAF domain-containing protein [Candidatus Manganitrophus sp.]